jgi:hypothetical protein
MDACQLTGGMTKRPPPTGVPPRKFWPPAALSWAVVEATHPPTLAVRINAAAAITKLILRI